MAGWYRGFSERTDIMSSSLSIAQHRLKILQRRRDFLTNRVRMNPQKDLSFDKAEAGAISWAIECLEDYLGIEQAGAHQ